MNKPLYTLYQSIYDNSQNQEARTFVSLVDAQIAEIEQIGFTSSDDFSKATTLFVDYGIHLANLGRFKQAILYLDKAAEFIEASKKDKNALQNQLYEKILLYRGVSFYNIRNYKKSRFDLIRLTNAFPQNIKYKNWYNKAVVAEARILQFIFAVLMASFAVLYFKTKSSETVWTSIGYSGMVGSLICLVIVDFMKRRRKKK